MKEPAGLVCSARTERVYTSRSISREAEIGVRDSGLVKKAIGKRKSAFIKARTDRQEEKKHNEKRGQLFFLLQTKGE
jgi:hypothetical protein